MIKKSVFLVALSIALIGLALSGCQDILNQIPFLNGNPAPEPAIIATSVPTSAAIPPPLPTQIAGQTEQLTIWLPPQFDPNNGTQAGELLKAQLEKFSSDYPDVMVNVRIKEESGSGGLLDSLNTASAAAPSILPGIVLLTRSDFETAAELGLLNPIEAADTNLSTDDWFTYARDMSQARGATYGIPFAGDILVMAYKPVQIGYPPLYWRDIIQQQAILALPAADPQAIIPILLYQQAGGFLPEGDQDVTLEEIPLQNSLQIISDGAVGNIFPYWLTEYASFDLSWQSLQDSSATYAIIWASQYLGEKPDNVTITSLPVMIEQPMTLAKGWVLAFPQTSQERYLTHLKLAEYLLEPEFQKAWSEAAGVLPASKSVLSSWNDAGLSGILSPIAESARLIPSNNVFNSLGTLLSNATQELIRKQVSYIQAANTILKELSE